MKELRVSEIFFSIQGESSLAGLPCIFVRLQGCGLRCKWCDTPYALEYEKEGELMSIDDILGCVAGYNSSSVELTGGEPLEQERCFELMTQLCDQGYAVALETGGHVDIGRVDSRVTVVMDLKCPGSGMMKKNRMENLDYIKPGDEIKFVIRDRSDYEWARNMLRGEGLCAQCQEVLFAPVFGDLHPRDLASWILEDGLQVRLQLQLHKLIWDPEMRGG